MHRLSRLAAAGAVAELPHNLEAFGKLVEFSLYGPP